MSYRIQNIQVPYKNERIIYVRSATGDDKNDGSSPANAVATLARARELTPWRNYGGYIVWDVSDSSFDLNEPFSFPEIIAGHDFILNPGGVAPGVQDIAHFPFELRAHPALVEPITLVGTSGQPTTGLQILDVSEVLVPNAHVGQIVLGNGGAQWGVIVSNTANQITTTRAAGGAWTAPLGIYEQSCTITTGDGADPFTSTTAVLPNRCSTFINGIRFRSHGKPHALQLLPTAAWLYLQLCDVDGFLLAGAANEFLTIDACYFSGGSFKANNSPVLVRSCFLNDIAFEAAGSGGSGDSHFINNWFEQVSGVGSGNAFESMASFRFDTCEIHNAPSHGITKNGPGRARITNCNISNCGGDAVRVACGGGHVILSGVIGGGNTGYGVYLENGAQARVEVSTVVTGASGDLRVGALGAVAYAGVPANDFASGAAAEGCRVF